MPRQLLPLSAAPNAARSSTNVVLSNKVDPWLTTALKRINKIKRPLNSSLQHRKCLTETLSNTNAIWLLCSIMLPKAPDADLMKDSNPLIEAIQNFQMIHVEAYVVHVDMVSQHEVAFKLTTESIDSLIEYHKDIFSVDTAANTWNWSEKEQQLKKLHEEFVQAVNRFVFRTGAIALEGLEEDGAGELLNGRSDEVRNAIMNLFVPLLPPPPPRIVEIVRPTPLLPSNHGPEQWWLPSHVPTMHPAPVDAWRIVPSSPSPPASCDGHHNNIWNVPMDMNNQLPSPTPSFEQPYTTAAYSAPQYYSAPAYSMPTSAPLPLPSMLTPQPCSTSAGMGTFGWDRYQEYSMPYATAM